MMLDEKKYQGRWMISKRAAKEFSICKILFSLL